tara:strand:+ start:16925 stop:17395 length:471 start_codon:yes stop_codon:yes gene_type:complete
MSNEAVLVKFPNGKILYTGYHGCSSASHNILFENKEQLFVDSFLDEEEEKLSETALYEEMQSFLDIRQNKVYPDVENVTLFTPYAGGSTWTGKASYSAKFLISGFSNLESCVSVDYESTSEWPQWVKDSGIPETKSLIRENWTNIAVKSQANASEE